MCLLGCFLTELMAVFVCRARWLVWNIHCQPKIWHNAYICHSKFFASWLLWLKVPVYKIKKPGNIYECLINFGCISDEHSYSLYNGSNWCHHLAYISWLDLVFLSYHQIYLTIIQKPWNRGFITWQRYMIYYILLYASIKLPYFIMGCNRSI